MKRKAGKLSVLIVTGLALYVTNVFSIPAIEMDYICPIGKEKFKSIDYSPQCPTNKFVMFKKEFTKEELKKYEKIINSKEYKAIPKTLPKEYYLAKFYEMAGGFSDKEIGETYYKAYTAQINWNSENTDVLKESLTKGIDYLEKSLSSGKKDDFPSSLAYLYISNREYDKANALIEKQNKDIHLEKISNFYYNISGMQRPEDDYYHYNRYKYYNESGVDEKAKKIFREKALSYLQAVIRKNNGQYSQLELFRQADLYSSFGNKKAVDELFSKTPSKYWEPIVSYYLDEPEGTISEVYNKNNLVTEADLKKALSYADKLEKMTFKSFKDNTDVEMKYLKRNDYLKSAILKAEAERRLGKFEEASKTLSKINIADIKDTVFNRDFEKLKELIGKRDGSVSQYTPLPIRY
ncbi:hypothetical protein JMUB3935_1352 [Leptotrichia trevisanii]|uniref:Uncharacterized protein n=1 Tax=Leptotrichia trevisanii TaxID=109328 RepID=A0A510KL50_9FUSO|nr:hypothetical protein [Leptotrichia trevisanii]BBM52374.1 hypothetical protein JMUB3935_1352 [Leptotrichia trevisanii]